MSAGVLSKGLPTPDVFQGQNVVPTTTLNWSEGGERRGAPHSVDHNQDTFGEGEEGDGSHRHRRTVG